MALKLTELSSEFFKAPIAHRGFHDCGGLFGSGRPENSMSAFEAATKHGFAIEIDLQLTSDNVPVIFHDKNIKRITGKDAFLRNLPLRDLKKNKLPNGESIPTFKELLNYLSGKVPLLVELKDQDGFFGPAVGALEFFTAEALKSYQGAVGVMSYNPYSVINFGHHLPGIPRGLVTEKFLKKFWPKISPNRLKQLRLQKDFKRASASFISHEHSNLDSKIVQKRKGNIKVLSWTIRNKSEMIEALKKAHNVTFEGFDPYDI